MKVFEYGSPFALLQGCLAECIKLRKLGDIPKLDGATDARNRMRDGLSVWLWKFSVVEDVPQFQLKLTQQKFRNRHFMIPVNQLDGGVTISPPEEPSLYKTSAFFMKLLDRQDFKTLQNVAHTLDGYKIRLGTTCSGSDIGVIAIKSILKEMNKQFGVTWHQHGNLCSVSKMMCIYIYTHDR